MKGYKGLQVSTSLQFQLLSSISLPCYPFPSSLFSFFLSTYLLSLIYTSYPVPPLRQRFLTISKILTLKVSYQHIEFQPKKDQTRHGLLSTQWYTYFTLITNRYVFLSFYNVYECWTNIITGLLWLEHVEQMSSFTMQVACILHTRFKLMLFLCLCNNCVPNVGVSHSGDCLKGNAILAIGVFIFFHIPQS